MATPERAEPGRDHVSMSELLASCVAARALSTPPAKTAEERDGAEAEPSAVRDEAA
ncbi:hypothetical protein ACGFYZ_14190 [Streptomyces sp. NPDC048330]|uniref:hypothetical protein n=1 Tax=Streptomyces sp. NPDC048330 TaxID=3365533 RepID=UPI003718271B